MKRKYRQLLGSKLASKEDYLIYQQVFPIDLSVNDTNYFVSYLWDAIEDTETKSFANKSARYKYEIPGFLFQGFANDVEFHIVIPSENTDKISLSLYIIYPETEENLLEEIKVPLLDAINLSAGRAKRKTKRKYLATISVDTEAFEPLDGVYSFHKYTLVPCEITERNQNRFCSSFVLRFEVDAINRRQAEQLSRKEAKEIIAWLSCITRRWMRLSGQSHGFSATHGPQDVVLTEKFDDNVLEDIFHIDEDTKQGEFVDIIRPDFSRAVLGSESLKLPSDFNKLTDKLFSLEKEARDRLINACMAYQFALEMWMGYPTISIVALVSAVESMMTEEDTSEYCEDAKKKCPLKRDVMKKFRMFFERNLVYPLPDDLNRFLNKVYHKRSIFVHKALLGDKGGRDPVSTIAELVEKESITIRENLGFERESLEKLVNATLIEWLRRY